jgi:hypothetical protein
MAERKLNCWEFKRCGREPGGSSVVELGICPATTTEETDGINGGTNGGRCCWSVSGTLCKGQVEGHFARKLKDCFACDFFELVQQEEERKFAIFP